MKITFDLAKSASNEAKHGISLARAEQLEWATAVVWADNRRSYGEPRMGALGYIGERLYFVAFVDRDDGRRVISLRRANQREIGRYAET